MYGNLLLMNDAVIYLKMLLIENDRRGLWNVLRTFNVEEGLDRIPRALYDGSMGSQLFSNQVG